MNVEGEKVSTAVNGGKLSDLPLIAILTSNPVNRSDMCRIVQEALSILPRVRHAVYDGDLSAYMEEVIEKCAGGPKGV